MYTQGRMRLSARSCLFVSVLLLIPVGVSAQVACCAGMASMDSKHSMEMDEAGCGEGMGCCDQAHDDAIAGHCCEGGEPANRLQPLRQVSVAALEVLPSAPAVREQTLGLVHGFRLPPPEIPDLLALHSVLLI